MPLDPRCSRIKVFLFACFLSGVLFIYVQNDLFYGMGYQTIYFGT